MMNTKSRMRVFYAEGIIELNTTFAKMMQNPLSDEYALLQKTRIENPTFTVRRRQIKKNPNKDTYKGLTYAFMESYIQKHDDDKKSIMAKYLLLRGKSVEAQENLVEPYSYDQMKNWFLKTFPAIDEFRKQCDKLVAAASSVHTNKNYLGGKYYDEL